MNYYLLQKSSKRYIVKKGYSTIAQLCREFIGKNPLVIKAPCCSFYPGDELGLREVKNLLITVDKQKYKPFIGVGDEKNNWLPFDNVY